MKKKTIKSHLSTYLIHQKRRTTINHAFASALAPTDPYDEKVVDDAIRALGQDPCNDLQCVYCGAPAATWDHLVGLVASSEMRGYGHQIGNLIPACNSCNSRKGSKDWLNYIQGSIESSARQEELIRKLTDYQARFARPVDLERVRLERPDEWNEYCQLREHILDLLKKADAIAAKLRPFVLSK